MVTTATPPTTPPAIAPVFELLPPENVDGGGNDGEEVVGGNDDNRVMGGSAVGNGKASVELVAKLGEPMNSPEPISGESTKYICELSKEKDRDEDSYHRQPSIC